MYNGKTIRAFYDNEDGEIIGFSLPVAVSELPAGTQENIERKYKGWQISETMMFIDNNGNTNYFVSATKSKKPTLVLKLNAKNNPFIYTKM